MGSTEHGSNGPTHRDYLDAMAQEVLDLEAIKGAQAIRKRNRKLVQAKGIVLEDVDLMVKRSEEPLSEIVDWLKRKLFALSAIFPQLQKNAKQFDLFEAQEGDLAAITQAGLLAGIRGTTKPPEGLTASELSAWQAGNNEGHDIRGAKLKEALEAPEGEVTDGTVSGAVASSATAQAVLDQARADEAQDRQEGNFEAPVEELQKQRGRRAIKEARDAEQPAAA